jgi:hypothetical protein
VARPDVACFTLCSGADTAPAVDEFVLDDERSARQHFWLARLPVGWVQPLKHNDVLSVAPGMARREGLLLRLRHGQGL